MKRIAFITNYLAPYRVDFYKQLTNNNLAFSFKFYLCYLVSDYYTKKWYPNTDELLFEEFPSSTLPIIKNLWFNRTFFNSLISYSPDIIISVGASASSLFAAFYSHIFRKELVIWWAGDDKSERKISYIKKIIRKYIFYVAKKYISYSEYAMSYLLKFGIKEEAILNIGNFTLDTEKFHTEVKNQAVNARTQKKKLNLSKVILIIGRLVESKNVQFALDIIASLQNDQIGLFIIGEGDLASSLCQYCKDNEIKQVYFWGDVKPSKMPFFYACGDILLHTSNLDRWPQVVNEAVAAGLPVIISKASMVPESFIKNGVNGYQVDSTDVGQWVIILQKLLSDETLCQNIHDNNIRLSNEHSIGNLSNKILSFI